MPWALAALCLVWEDARGGPTTWGMQGKEEEGKEPRKLLEKASCWRSSKAETLVTVPECYESKGKPPWTPIFRHNLGWQG